MDNASISAHPPVATREEWLAARRELLAAEKAHTKEYDRINAMRRRLPMVKVDKDYVFHDATGAHTLFQLFDGKTQLIVQHFMFEPEWEKGCPGCTSFVDALADLSSLESRDVRFVIVSIAPFEKLAAYRDLRGWNWPWYSSQGCDFNFDFGVTFDPARGSKEYNYKSTAESPWLSKVEKPTELPGVSAFLRMGEEVYHTYSTFQRGTENLVHSSALLDITPYGRQEDFEDSPPGWPQRPTYG
ncbi:MAG: DUF899 domain-containing protein [Armatimonadetes bacterium]|nr:DUF899 domain-containing protein [Armatimonadota bacterium]